ncbi:ATP-binding cassette domain-containing protein [Salinibius halmophilus]|uniref:ATP-binding cassette domain-containing protein n=1 Tax=Salinibius halmophilus TaxID=1853216 RepID=UPI000E675D1D|nr:ABC transporter ATP-binding protein [Salinibius halmophilus]
MNWPTLWQQAWRRQVVTLVLMSIVVAVLTFFLALLMAKLSLLATTTGLLLFIGLLLFRWLLLILVRTQGERLGQRYIAQVRATFFERWLNVSSDQAPPRFGVMIMRLISDANALKRWIALGWLQLLTSLLTVAAIILASLLNWPALVAPFAVFLLLFVIWHAVLTYFLVQSERAIRRARGKLSGQVGEFTMARLAAIQMRWLGRITRRLNNASEELGAKSAAQQWPAMLANGLLDAATPLLIVFLSIQFAGDASNLAAALLILGLLSASLVELSQAWLFGCKFYVARQRLSQVAINMASPSAGGSLKKSSAAAVALRSVQLDGMGVWQASADAGRRIWVHGRGKSALAKLFFRQLAPKSGYVMVGGRKMHNLSRKALYGSIAVETGEIPLVRGSLRRNLSGGVSDEQLLEILQWVGLKDFSLEHKIGELGRGLTSTEQWQVRLARALSKAPAVLYLDDPPARLLPALERICAAFPGTLLIASDSQMDLPFDDHWQLDPVSIV